MAPRDLKGSPHDAERHESLALMMRKILGRRVNIFPCLALAVSKNHASFLFVNLETKVNPQKKKTCFKSSQYVTVITYFHRKILRQSENLNRRGMKFGELVSHMSDAAILNR